MLIHELIGGKSGEVGVGAAVVVGGLSLGS